MDDPEIVDADDDTTGSEAGQDIVRSWIEIPEDNDKVLHVFVQSKEDFEHPPSYFANHIRYSVRFVPSNPDALAGGNVEAYVDMRPTRAADPAANVYLGDDTLECRFGKVATAGATNDVASERLLTPIFEDGSLFGCVLPFAELGSFGPGDSITSMFVELQEVSRGPISSGDTIPVTVRDVFDRAPDEGFGREFMVPMLPIPEDLPATFEEASGNDTLLQDRFTFANGTNQVRSVNWTTGLDSAEIFFETADVSGGAATFEVRDTFGTLLLNGTFTGNFSGSETVTGAEPGQWTLRVVYDEFVGSFVLRLGVPGTVSYGPYGEPVHGHMDDGALDGDEDGAVPGGDGHVHSDDHHGDGNGTTDDAAPKSKDTPGPVPVLVAAVLVGLVALRRRRYD